MQTDDMELKKLVYLYLINYAKTQPDLAIMAVNTFVKVPGGWLPRCCPRCGGLSCMTQFNHVMPVCRWPLRRRLPVCL